MKRILTAVFVLLASLTGTSVFAQGGYQIKGVVVDAQGPVIGATVMEQGTTVGTVTGLDGDYVLTVSGADAVIEVSCIGYATQVFTASALPRTVELAEDAEFLDEVVVIGYGTVKKSDMTGSVVAIKSDEVNRGAITTPGQALVGKVSGLLVTPPSGQPGSSSTIRIRGAASLNANNDPLIVIDGVPVTGDGGAGMGDPLASVNPNDIETFSVLKDASATAIYGSRASNGVIIITTKKGSKGALKVSANVSLSAKQNIATLDMMSGDQLRSYMSSVYGADSQRVALLGTDNTDWQKEIYRIATGADYNFTVMGGNFVPFRVSFGYNSDNATLKAGSNDRFNLDVNLSPKFFDDHLSVNANVKGIYQLTEWANTSAVGNAIAFDPTKPVYGDKGKYWNWYSGGSPNSLSSVNPLSCLYECVDASDAKRSIGNLQLDYKIHGFEDLRLNLNLGYDVARNDGRKYNILGTYLAAKSSPDLSTRYVNFNRNLLLEAYADYNHEFAHSNLDVMAGYSWQSNFVRYQTTNYYNHMRDFDEAYLYEAKPVDSKEYVLMSFFGRLNYSLLSRYLFTVTLREDASSRFSKANRWGLFPSAAFAWNIVNEPFMEGQHLFNALKLRLGWGRTGQQDIGSDYYPYLARYVAETTQNMRYNMGIGNYNTLAPLAYNPNIKWETTETYNVGLDYALSQDRVTGSVEAYYRRTFDLLNLVSVPLGSNFSNVLMSNIGEMVNKGVEVSLNVIPVETEVWHWSVGGNVTLQDTKITKLTEQNVAGYLGVTTGPGMGGTGGYTSLHRLGFAPNTFYLFEQLYDSEGQPILNGLVDRDGDGMVTDSDRYVTGYSPNPWLYFGVNTRLGWKKWDFSVNGHGSIGNYAINKVAMGYASSYSDDFTKGYINNLSNAYLIDGWTAPVETSQKYSDLFVENASFFKVDDINLGYTFDLNRWWMKTLRVAGSIQNVCTFTKYRGLDPELGPGSGVDDSIVPRPRLYTIRLNMNF